MKLLKDLHARFPHATIHGHRDFAAKACPSFDATLEYKHLAMAMILIFACLFISACKSTQQTLDEKVDSTRLETASSSTTSLATDKFLQNIVLNIDSIVYTSLYVPQMIEGDNETSVIGHPSDISDKMICSGASLTKGLPPHNNKTKVVVHGLRLESNTADSSSVKTVINENKSHNSSYHSNLHAKEKKVPSIRWPLTLIAIAAIIIAALAFLIRKGMKSS